MYKEMFLLQLELVNEVVT